MMLVALLLLVASVEGGMIGSTSCQVIKTTAFCQDITVADIIQGRRPLGWAYGVRKLVLTKPLLSFLPLDQLNIKFPQLEELRIYGRCVDIPNSERSWVHSDCTENGKYHI